MDLFERDRLKPLSLPAYTVAFLLVFVPLADTAAGLLPVRYAEVQWRFGALGLLSQTVMTPLLGVLVALVVGAVLGHRRRLRFLEVLMILAALVLLAAGGLFALDAVQTHISVRPEARLAFARATVIALAKYGLGFLSTIFVAVACHRIIRSQTAAEEATPQLVSAQVKG